MNHLLNLVKPNKTNRQKKQCHLHSRVFLCIKYSLPRYLGHSFLGSLAQVLLLLDTKLVISHSNLSRSPLTPQWRSDPELQCKLLTWLMSLLTWGNASKRCCYAVTLAFGVCLVIGCIYDLLPRSCTSTSSFRCHCWWTGTADQCDPQDTVFTHNPEREGLQLLRKIVRHSSTLSVKLRHWCGISPLLLSLRRSQSPNCTLPALPACLYFQVNVIIQRPLSDSKTKFVTT